jgi:hypothetical protein
MLNTFLTIRFNRLNDQSLSGCYWYAQEWMDEQERSSMDSTGIDHKDNYKRPGYKRTQV